MFSACTLTGILPTACTPSVWKSTPRSRHSFADLRDRLNDADFIVREHDRDQHRLLVDGGLRSSRSIRPSAFTGKYVTRRPDFSRCLHVSSTALCSVTAVMMWLPFSRYISATPLSARLFDSVAPEVKIISFAVAPISFAICYARSLHRLFRLPAEAVVAARRVAELRRQIRQHRLKHPRIERRRRMVVHDK